MESSPDDDDDSYSLLLAQYFEQSESAAKTEMELTEPRLLFEISSEDGFFVRANTCEGES
jgi:hypothetical protein